MRDGPSDKTVISWNYQCNILTTNIARTGELVLKDKYYTDGGIRKENAQRLNLSCVTEAVMPRSKRDAL